MSSDMSPHEPDEVPEIHRIAQQIDEEIDEEPLDPDVTVAPRPYPHPWTLLRANADLLPVIALGGVLGSLARWGVAEAIPHRPDQFAWATFIVNVTGSLLLGLLMAFVLDVWSHHRYTRPFLGVGVLGGYTTFSTWMLDTRGQLVDRPAVAAAYVVGTLAVGMLAVTAGLVGGRVLIDARNGGSEESDEETKESRP